MTRPPREVSRLPEVTLAASLALVAVSAAALAVLRRTGRSIDAAVALPAGAR